MAFQIGNNTVINNSRKGIFLSTNPGVYTNATRPTSPSTGDIIYNSDAGAIQVWTGSTWKNAGGVELTTGTGGNTVENYTDPQGGTWKIHIFTSPGTFTLTSVGNAQLGEATSITSLVVGGGGGGGRDGGGGGGAGGILELVHPATVLAPYSGSGIPITVGNGGNGGLSNPGVGSNGGSSSFGTLNSVVGGGGGGSVNKSNPASNTSVAGSPGGSGGGGGGSWRQASPGGTKAASGVPLPFWQGTDGGAGRFTYDSRFSAGGGGGGSTAGVTAPSSSAGGRGGQGRNCEFYPDTIGEPSPVAGWRVVAGGGAGNGWTTNAVGGEGGGGNSCRAGNTTPAPTNLTLIQSGVNGTGGGGGGSTWGLPTSVNRGGNGIVVIKYRRVE